jgi:hypothetical protein
MKIPIKRYVRDETLPIEEQYKQLEAHHEEETTYLVPRVFNDEELGTILAALASFSIILANLEDAKDAGFVPPCFETGSDGQTKVVALMDRIRKQFMT